MCWKKSLFYCLVLYGSFHIYDSWTSLPWLFCGNKADRWLMNLHKKNTKNRKSHNTFLKTYLFIHSFISLSLASIYLFIYIFLPVMMHLCYSLVVVGNYPKKSMSMCVRVCVYMLIRRCTACVNELSPLNSLMICHLPGVGVSSNEILTSWKFNGHEYFRKWLIYPSSLYAELF